MVKRWTEDELDFVADNVGVLSYGEISARIGRSKDAIKVRRCVNKMPSYFNHPNSYSYSVLSEELGVGRKWLRARYKAGLLKGRKASWTTVWGKPPMVFLERDIVEFLKSNYYELDPNRILNPYFRNIVWSCYLSDD